MLDIALVGTGGMMPLPNRFLSSALLRFKGDLLLIDCGEGTQVSLKMLGFGFKNISTICFTHFHGDHISGLPGLLLTIANAGRTEPILMIGPKGLEHVVTSLCVIATDLPFSINFIELEKNHGPINRNDFIINTQELKHSTLCVAYTFNIARPPKFDPLQAVALNIPKHLWSILQKGNTIEIDGKTFDSNMVLGQPRKGLKVGYCTDTRPVESLVSFMQDADLFICEGIYGEQEKLEKAIEYKHMTFAEAATIANLANVDELWLTHYSPSLVEPDLFLHVATDIFSNSHCGYDRKLKSLLWNN